MLCKNAQQQSGNNSFVQPFFAQTPFYSLATAVWLQKGIHQFCHDKPQKFGLVTDIICIILQATQKL